MQTGFSLVRFGGFTSVPSCWLSGPPRNKGIFAARFRAAGRFAGGVGAYFPDVPVEPIVKQAGGGKEGEYHLVADVNGLISN